MRLKYRFYCNDDIENLIFALTRLFNVLNYQIPIRVYPDQSVSANDLKRIKNLFSQVSVTTESDAASHLDPGCTKQSVQQTVRSFFLF